MALEISKIFHFFWKIFETHYFSFSLHCSDFGGVYEHIVAWPFFIFCHFFAFEALGMCHHEFMIFCSKMFMKRNFIFPQFWIIFVENWSKNNSKFLIKWSTWPSRLWFFQKLILNLILSLIFGSFETKWAWFEFDNGLSRVLSSHLTCRTAQRNSRSRARIFKKKMKLNDV